MINLYRSSMYLISLIFTTIVVIFIKQYTKDKKIFWLILAMISYGIITWSYTVILSFSDMAVMYSLIKILNVLLITIIGYAYFGHVLTTRQTLGIVTSMISLFLLA